MKSGLEGRNNLGVQGSGVVLTSDVSMKSGLEGRNNDLAITGPVTNSPASQ